MRTHLLRSIALALFVLLLPAAAAAQPVQRVKDENTLITPQRVLKFTGGGVACANDGAGKQITCTIGTGAGGVTGVTALDPLSSSGGLTPQISVTGQVAVANGGTGAANAAGARTNLSAAESGVNTTAEAIPGYVTELVIDTTTYAAAPAAAGVNIIAQKAADFDEQTWGNITQPVHPRNAQVVFSAGWDGGNVEIYGLMARGKIVSEVVVAAAGTTVQTVGTYLRVTRVRNLGTRSAGTVDVQTGPKISAQPFSGTGNNTFGFLHVFEATAGLLAGTSISAEGAIDLGAAPPDGARVYVIAYPLTRALENTSHDHGQN